MNLTDIAQVCHEANRAIQIVGGDPNPSQHWAQAPQEERDSAISGVVKAVDGETPEELHRSWCDYKRMNGWVYGKAKNPVAMTHPCLVPYEDLPREQKSKDRVFAAIVDALTHQGDNA